MKVSAKHPRAIRALVASTPSTAIHIESLPLSRMEAREAKKNEIGQFLVFLSFLRISIATAIAQ
jgi:hypothetical protein